MITISDTTPIHYLIILGRTEILPKIFGEIIIPEAVADDTSESPSRSKKLDCFSTGMGTYS